MAMLRLQKMGTVDVVMRQASITPAIGSPSSCIVRPLFCCGLQVWCHAVLSVAAVAATV